MKYLVDNVRSTIARWKSLLPIMCIIAMTLLLLASPGKVLADPPELSISIVPSPASFPAAQGNTSTTINAEVEVTNNGTTDTLHVLQLCWFTNSQVTITANNASGNCINTDQMLNVGEQYVWDVALLSKVPLAQSDEIEFEVHYLRPKGVHRYEFQSLSVQSLQPQTIDKVADITVLTSLDTLNDQQPGQLFLQITNKSNFALSVIATKIITESPGFISLDTSDFKQDVTIPPGQQMVFKVDIQTTGPIPAGKQYLIFEVPISWMEDGQLQTSNLVATQEIDVGIFGSSEILSLLGIPTLLVLPGFLVTATLLLLLKFFASQISTSLDITPITSKASDLGSIVFWMAAISFSMIADFIYFLLTKIKIWVAYTLQDVIKIWFGSIVVPALLFFLVFGVIKLGMRIRELWLQRFIPAENDSPTTILRKLHNQGLDLVCKYVPLKIGDEVRYVFLLEKEAPGKNDYWVSPAIVVRWNKDSIQSPLQQQFNEYLKNKNVGAMADFLDKKITWVVSWRQLTKNNSGDVLIGKPYRAKLADMSDSSSNPQIIYQQFIVEQEFSND